MCGLVGMAGDILQKHEEMFKEMLIYDSIRGFHSTGVAFIGGGGNNSLIKFFQ